VGRADALGSLTAVEHDPGVSNLASLIRLEWLLHTRPREATHTIESRLPALLDQFAAVGDERGLARAHMIAFNRDWLASRATPAARELKLAAEHAQNAGDDGLLSRALALMVATLIYGPTPAGEMAAELDRIEERGRGAYLQGFVEAGRCEVERLEGRFDEARRRARRSTSAFAAILQGWGWDLLAAIEVSDGDLAAALAALEQADALDVEFGEHAFRSTHQARIAEVRFLRDERNAARAAIELLRHAERRRGRHQLSGHHRVRARLALAEGDGAEAERWAQSAVRHAFLTDFPVPQAEATLDLARVLSALGRPAPARAQARAALALYESKGDRPGVARTRAMLDEL
jgi:hypothetical protein